MTLPNTPVILFLLLCSGALAWLAGLLLAVFAGVHALGRALRRSTGRHRAIGSAAEVVEDESVVAEHSGLSLLRRCPAEYRATLHLISPDNSGTCWVCQRTTMPEGVK
ncbi:hypothetical protein [Streptomyces sp. NPDC051173]|uniref:hypothetical protein n=1 Tax=Streptomyces sp. NPDC051173 TaxID=3155164 RepID=UPI00344FEE56